MSPKFREFLGKIIALSFLFDCFVVLFRLSLGGPGRLAGDNFFLYALLVMVLFFVWLAMKTKELSVYNEKYPVVELIITLALLAILVPLWVYVFPWLGLFLLPVLISSFL